jgi:hypothetical protein
VVHARPRASRAKASLRRPPSRLKHPNHRRRQRRRASSERRRQQPHKRWIRRLRSPKRPLHPRPHPPLSRCNGCGCAEGRVHSCVFSTRPQSDDGWAQSQRPLLALDVVSIVQLMLGLIGCLNLSQQKAWNLAGAAGLHGSSAGERSRSCMTSEMQLRHCSYVLKLLKGHSRCSTLRQPDSAGTKS